ncbi:MAG: type VI secretion system protein TssA [Proteobacteria bacterium]|nr:type VI secretion system protein TssA [Pseudomonadota bacterium]
MTTDLMDTEALLAPISSENPAGIDIRKDTSAQTLYRQAKQARANARGIERQQLQGNNLSSKTDWKNVYRLSVNILTTQAKDIEVATWLIEAGLRLHGFTGLSAGFKFTANLIEKYWEILYPLPDEEGLLTKVGPFIGLNGEDVEGSLIAPLALTPILEFENGTVLTLWHYQQARQNSEASKLEEIKAAIQVIPVETLKDVLNTLESCIAHFSQLVAILNEKCANQSPPSSRVFEQLRNCLECFRANTTTLVTEAPTKKEPIAPKIEAKPSIKIPTPREQALENLVAIAQFFRDTEPHSPLPYILERAVRWGKMALPDLLKELLQDESSKKQLNQLTGIEFK